MVYEELLTRLEVNIEDSQTWTLALILIDRYLAENQHGACTVYRMRPAAATRRLVRDGRIVNLFQGAYPVDTRDVYLRRSRVTGRTGDCATSHGHAPRGPRGGQPTRR